jgi:lantibiotic modifying enzyme
MHTNAAVRQKIIQIEQQLFDSYLDNTSLSLLNGKSGLLLLYFRLYTVFGDESYSSKCQVITERLLDDINKGITSFTYCDGLTGAACLFNYLREKAFFDDSVDDLLKQCDEILYDALQVALDNANWDYLHGAIGMALYFMDRQRSDNGIGQRLETVMERIITMQPGMGEEQYCNCGMAHGLVSVLMLLSRYASIGARPAYIRSAIRAAADRLLSFRSMDPASLSVFPSIVKIDDPSAWTYKVPLGWCYGDTAISVGLYQAGKTLQDTALMHEAAQLALHATKRNTRATARVFDACFCHGAAGVAHIFSKWYRLTKDPVFYESYHHWICQTLELCSFEDGIGGYKKFTGDTYTAQPGLLDGAAGVALVLADYISNAPGDWDQFFLLS